MRPPERRYRRLVVVVVSREGSWSRGEKLAGRPEGGVKTNARSSTTPRPRWLPWQRGRSLYA